MDKWRIVIDLSYQSKDTCIQEFERIAATMKGKGYCRHYGGSGSNIYGVQGPPEQPFTNDEIAKIRNLIA